MSTHHSNCWEVMNCLRQSDGLKVKKLGVCPVITHYSANGLNNGKNAGRICWAIAGSSCGDKRQGTFARKIKNCVNCSFFKSVKAEEKPFILIPPNLEYSPTKMIVKLITDEKLL